MSQIIKTRVPRYMNKHLKFCKLRVIFQTNSRLRNYFSFKDSVPEILRSSLFINSRAQPAQHPKLVRPIDTSK